MLRCAELSCYGISGEEDSLRSGKNRSVKAAIVSSPSSQTVYGIVLWIKMFFPLAGYLPCCCHSFCGLGERVANPISQHLLQSDHFVTPGRRLESARLSHHSDGGDVLSALAEEATAEAKPAEEAEGEL